MRNQIGSYRQCRPTARTQRLSERVNPGHGENAELHSGKTGVNFGKLGANLPKFALYRRKVFPDALRRSTELVFKLMNGQA